MFLTMEEISLLHKKLLNGEYNLDTCEYICALSDTKEDFAVVRKCRIDRNPDKGLSNFFPDQEGIENNTISCIIWDSDGMITGYPIPDKFNVISAKFIGKQLLLESDNGQKVCFEQWQLSRNLGFVNEITTDELEKKFFECQNISNDNVKKTKKQKNYINILGIGKLIYNADEEQFEILHNSIVFSIEDISSASKMKTAKKIIKQIFKATEKYSEIAKKYAAKELMSVKNNNWLNEKENELSEYEFIKRLNLISVNIQEDRIVFEFDDNDLFWGHYIECEFDIDLTPVSAVIID